MGKVERRLQTSCQILCAYVSYIVFGWTKGLNCEMSSNMCLEESYYI